MKNSNSDYSDHPEAEKENKHVKFVKEAEIEEMEESGTEYSDVDKTEVGEFDEEHMRLGGRKAFITLMHLSTGPLVSQISAALYSIADQIWVARTIGDVGMAAISAFTILDTFSRAFGFFLSVAASSRISALMGEGKGSLASRILVDLLRIALLCGIIIPLIFIPVAKPMARWFGADEGLVNMGYEYILPCLSFAFIQCIFQLLCGVLQAEGRTMMFGVVQVCASLLNVIVFDPLFLLFTDMGLKGASIATIVSESTMMLILLIMFINGKFSTRIESKYLFMKPAVDTWPAVKVGLSMLIANLSVAVPDVIMRKYIGSIVEGTTEFNDVMAAFNAFGRIFLIENAVMVAFTMGMLPAASYAFAAERYKRVMLLFFHATWVTLIWSLFNEIMCVFFSFYVVRIFSTTPSFVKWAGEMVRAANYMILFTPTQYLVTTLLQSLGMGLTASIFGISTQLIPIPMFGTILFFTNKTDIIRLMKAYTCNDALSLLISLLFLISPMKMLMGKIKEKIVEENAQTGEEIPVDQSLPQIISSALDEDATESDTSVDLSDNYSDSEPQRRKSRA